MLGDTSRDLGQPKEAAEYYKRARDTSLRWTSLDQSGIEIQKQLYFAYLGLGDISGRLKLYTDSIHAFEKGVEVVRQRPQNGPTTPAGQIDLVYLYSKLGEMNGKLEKYDDARKNYEMSRDLALRVVEADAKNYDARRRAFIALEGIGDILSKQKKFDEARSQYDAALLYARQMVEAYPKNADYLLSLSWIEVLTGHFKEAMDAANRGLEISKDDILLTGNLAHAYLLGDNFDQARELYQRFKDKRHNGRTFAAIVQDDFQRLRELKLLSEAQEAELLAIEKLLGL
jgi:tetratricopeptide (TPR) repeat protein